MSGCEVAGGKVEWMIRRILRGFETASRRGAEKGTPTSKTLQSHNGRKHLSLYCSLTLHPLTRPLHRRIARSEGRPCGRACAESWVHLQRCSVAQ